MTLDIAFPHDGSSLEPRPMRAQEIWSVADQGTPPARSAACLDLDRLTRASAGVRVKGVTYWDFERSIRNGRGREAPA